MEFKTNDPCPCVRHSTPWALLCTDLISNFPRGISFSFCTWNEHILKLCLVVLFLKNLKKCNFGDFLKNGNY